MKTVIAATCLVSLVGILLLMAIGPQAEAKSLETVALSELPAASAPPKCGLAEKYEELNSLRLRRIADLEAYAAAGNFPVNSTNVDMTPVFVDENDTPCAVGHLMRCSGATELVGDIAAGNNLVKLHEVKDGPVVEWIKHSGLTKEECELIQPSYEGWPDREPRRPIDVVDTRESGIKHIRARLEAVARKLRKDTAASMELALSRVGSGHEFVQAGTGLSREYRNAGAPMLARVSTIDADGNLTATGEWHEVAAEIAFTLPVGDTLLLETRPLSVQ